MIVVAPILFLVCLFAFFFFRKLLKHVKWEDEYEADQAVDWVKNYLAETKPFEL
jgi:hypothetical protein